MNPSRIGVPASAPSPTDLIHPIHPMQSPQLLHAARLALRYHERRERQQKHKSREGDCLRAAILDAEQARPHVLLIMDGGIIHEILGTYPTDVSILDYDTQGAPDEDVVTLDRPGYGKRAYHSARSTDVLPAEIETI